ncbi:hypothetical protein [Luteimonas sp. MC1572]|uniref:hypothetical protein n=1 Tax=Luteimonas sp. MC1572 TaxID=2799325 RepID=UPI0018F0C60E|nr:hypothetical protein [Luteimonas sp. MC1572]MBJ6980377.1 hypothetical protein [Luteimonas sp. MC1572]QQO04260.1 hypothetical protein JGR64_05845 [Luteimonas sp. MC1572]
MPSLDDAKKKLDELSAQVSTIVRTVAAGVLAIVWLFLSGDSDSPPLLSAVPAWLMALIALLAISSITFDLLQYVTAYEQVSKARTAAKKAGLQEVDYSDSPLKDWRYRFYAWKYYAAIASAVLLIASVGWAVVDDLFF